MPIRDLKKRKEYHARYMKEVWYPKNKKKHIGYVKRLKLKVREFVQEYKSKGKCADCGLMGKNTPYVLDFDHRNGKADKKFMIGEWIKSTLSIEKIRLEMNKCDLVCANCHRIRTHKRSKQVTK